MKRQRRTDLGLLVICLTAALAGQYYFSRLPHRFWDGVFFYAVSVISFALLLARRSARGHQGEAVSFWKRVWQVLRTYPERVWALIFALFCTYTTIRLNEAGLNGHAVLFWLAGIVLNILLWIGLRQEPIGPMGAETDDQVIEIQAGVSAAARAVTAEEVQTEAAGPVRMPARGWARRAVPLRWVAARWEVLALAGCTLGALLLRLAGLGTIPYVISGDEASMGLEAIRVLQGQVTDPFATGWLSHPTLYFYMMAGPIALLGRNAWGLRLLSPLVGAATIPVLYLLARRLFDRRVAFAAAVLLAASHLHIHFSRLGINNIYDPLLGLLAFLFLVRGLQEGRLLDFALSGSFLAFAQFFYTGARLLPILAAVYIVLWVIVRQVHIGWLAVPGLAMGSAFLITGGPLFRFFILHPDDFMARPRMVGIIQMGWLQTEPLVTGKSVLELLWDQLRKSFFAFNFSLDPTSWYAAEIPYLDFVSAVCFILGLVVLLRSWRRQGHLLVNVWFWLALVFGGVLIENPPSSPRFVIFMPAVCLAAALGLSALLELAAGLVGLPRRWPSTAMALVILAAVILNVGYYFLVYTPSGRFGGLNTEVGTRVGEYLRDQEPGSQVYFFGPPRMWVGYATIPYLAPGMDLHDVESPLTAPPDVQASGDILFIFLPERAKELAWVIQAFPDGHYREHVGQSGAVLFSVYEVRR